MIKISTSILKGKEKKIEMIKKINETSADFLHLDISDGNFAPNPSKDFKEIKEWCKYTTKPLDIHLMVTDPKPYIENYSSFNPEYITVHYEIDQLHNQIAQIKSHNIKVGISIKPNTKVEELYSLLDTIDLVLVMSVEPGYGGQKFMMESLEKVKQLKKYTTKHNLNTTIEIDGGVNDQNAPYCIEAGVDILVAGSFITLHDDYEKQIKELRNGNIS